MNEESNAELEHVCQNPDICIQKQSDLLVSVSLMIVDQCAMSD